MEFKDKVVLVTGATSGIGIALTTMFREQGARVVAVGRSVAKLKAFDGDDRVVPVSADISSIDGVEKAFTSAVDLAGPLDVVCANAGIYLDGNVWENPADQIQQLINTNVVGAMNTVRYGIESMQGRQGDIIVTCSVAGYQAIEWEPVYSGSKNAIKAFVHGVRRQLVGSGIRISSLAPGIVLNDLWLKSAPDRANPASLEDTVAAGEGLRSSDVAEAARWILTQPRHVTIRDLVLLPTNQDI